MQPFAELALQGSQEHRGRYAREWQLSIKQSLPSATVGCTHLEFEAQPAEPIPHYLSKASGTVPEMAARSNKVRVIKEVYSDEAGLVRIRLKHQVGPWQPSKAIATLRSLSAG